MARCLPQSSSSAFFTIARAADSAARVFLRCRNVRAGAVSIPYSYASVTFVTLSGPLFGELLGRLLQP